MTSATNVKPSFRVRSRTPPGRGNVTVTSDILPINVLACPHTAVCGAPNEGVSFSVGFYFFSSKTSPSYYAGSRPLMSLWLTDVISLRTQIRHTHEGRLWQILNQWPHFMTTYYQYCRLTQSIYV